MAESKHNCKKPFAGNLAVVIGINQYQYQHGISQLQTARFDAERLTDILQTKYNYEVKLFTDEQAKSNNNWEKATSNNIWNYLKTELSQKIKSYENKRVRLLFYFAGHGTPPEGEDGEAGYLLPQDAQISRRDKWLSMKELHDVLIQLGCHHLLIILDCCYAGAFRFGTRHIGVMPEDLSQERYQRYLEYPAGQVIASTTHNQQALDLINDNRGTIENSNHSPFAEFLFRALEEGTADYTKDGITTVTELSLYLSENLYERTKDQKRPQVSRTWFLPKLDEGEFFFQTGEFAPEKLPDAIALNKENNPYRGLQPFEEAHSRFFFGRHEKIQELQARLNCADESHQPVVVFSLFLLIVSKLDKLALLHLHQYPAVRPLTVVLGISGSGKSSLVKAGLIPKLRENQAQWRILEPICPGATVFKDLAKAVLPLKLEDSDPDLEPLKQLDELLRQTRRRSPHDEELKDLFAKWRKTAPEDKLLLIIKHFDPLKELCGDEAKQQSLEALRKIGLSRSRLVLDHLKELKQYCNSAEREQLDNFYHKCKEQIQDLSEAWKKDSKQFGEFIAKYCPENKQVKVLLVVDQFEQAIAQCSQEERKQLLNALHSALKVRPQQLRLVLTLRSDFQHYFENSEQFKEYWEKACFPVKQMERDQLREVIEQPALAQVLYFETKNGRSLVDNLLDDVGETSGALPLLSFTLSELYYKYVEKQRYDRTLTWEDYNELGGVTQSLTRRATEEYNNLAKDFVDGCAVEIDPSEVQARQTILRWVMLRMVTLDGGEKAKRRVIIDPPELNELNYPDKETNKRRQLVIDRFVDARLLVTGTNLEGNSYVEPAHDVLVREWDKITTWLSEAQEEVNGKQKQTKPKPHNNKGFRLKLPSIGWNKKPEREQERFNLNLQRELTIAANQWKSVEPNREAPQTEKQPQKAVDWLWDDDPRLPLAEQIYRSTDNWLNRAEAEFVRSSVGRHQFKTRRNWSIAGLVILGLSGLTITTLIQWRTAELNLANSLARNALSRFAEGNELDSLVDAIKAGKRLQQHQANDPQVMSALLANIYEGSERNRLQGLEHSVISVSFSPDDKTLLASGSGDTTIKLWHVETGEELHTLQGHDGDVMSISFSPDGQTLASGSEDTTVKLWNLETGKEIRTLQGHNGWVDSISFSPDGQTLVSGSRDATIKLWDIETGKEVRTLQGHDGWVNSVSFSPDGKTLASGSNDKTIKLWDVATGAAIRTLIGHNDPVWSVRFSPDGQTLASGSWDTTIKLWNLGTGAVIHTLLGHEHWVKSVRFSPDGQTLASGSFDKTIKLWDVATGAEIRALQKHDNPVWSVSFSPDGQTLASGSFDRDGTVKLWHLETRQEIRTLQGYLIDVFSVSFSSDGQTLASGSWYNTIKLWDLKTGKVIRALLGHYDRVMSVSFSPDGQTLASGSRDKTIKLWNPETGAVIHTLTGHENTVNSVRFSPDGQTLASGSYDETIKLWNVETGAEILTLTGHDHTVYGISFSPDGKTLASGSRDKTIKLWNVETGAEIRTLIGHDSDVYSVSFSPDGKTLASGGWDNRIRLWYLETGEEIRTFLGHDNFVNSVSFSPDGKTLASGSEDKTVKLWDLETGEVIRTLLGHDDTVWSVSFSPDGQTLASGSFDSTIKLWDTDLDFLMERSCDRIRNYLLHNPKVSEADSHLCDRI